MRELRGIRVIRGGRRRGVLGLVVVGAALSAAGVAYAWHGGFSSASSTSASFTATTVANSSSQTCTAANKDSIQVTNATYSGTATSTDTHLSGAITIDANSVYDATTNVGTVTGNVTIGSAGTGFFGRLVLVNTGGKLQGLVVGFEGGGGQLLGNLSSSFSTTGGFTGPATIGSPGTASDSAIVTTGSCASAQQGDDDQDDDNGGSSQFSGLGKIGGSNNFAGAGQFTGFGRHHDD